MEHPLYLLLTGPPSCGKTTVILRLAELLRDLRLAGFYTRELRQHTGFTYDPQKGSDSIRDPHGYTVMKVITPRLPAEFPEAELYLGVQVPNACFNGAA